MRARELKGKDTAHGLNLVSAAYAESGDFDSAFTWAMKSFALLASTEENRKELRELVEQSKGHKPIRIRGRYCQ